MISYQETKPLPIHHSMGQAMSDDNMMNAALKRDEEDEYDMPQLFNFIVRYMQDDDNHYRQNTKLQWWFEEPDDATKAVIDNTLIHICGWS